MNRQTREFVFSDGDEAIFHGGEILQPIQPNRDRPRVHEKSTEDHERHHEERHYCQCDGDIFEEACHEDTQSSAGVFDQDSDKIKDEHFRSHRLKANNPIDDVGTNQRQNYPKRGLNSSSGPEIGRQSIHPILIFP